MQLYDPDQRLEPQNSGCLREWPFLLGPVLGALGGAYLWHRYVGIETAYLGVCAGATVGLFLGAVLSNYLHYKR